MPDVPRDRRVPARRGGGCVSDEKPSTTPARPPVGGPGRFATVGMPAEKSRDFGGSTRRLIARMRPERNAAIAVIALALVSVGLFVIGPRILGHATDILFDGMREGGVSAIDFGALHRTLLLAG